MQRVSATALADKLFAHLAFHPQEVRQFRRRPDAAMILPARRRDAKNSSASVALTHSASNATSVASDPLLHDEAKKAVDMRHKLSRKAGPLRHATLKVLAPVRLAQKLIQETRRRVRVSVAERFEPSVLTKFLKQRGRLGVIARPE